MFAFDVAPTLGALSGLVATVLAVWTFSAGQRAKTAQRNVDVVRVAQEALVGTIGQMEVAMRRQDIEHQAEIEALHRKIADIEAHHIECERERAELLRRLAELETR